MPQEAVAHIKNLRAVASMAYGKVESENAVATHIVYTRALYIIVDDRLGVALPIDRPGEGVTHILRFCCDSAVFNNKSEIYCRVAMRGIGKFGPWIRFGRGNDIQTVTGCWPAKRVAHRVMPEAVAAIMHCEVKRNGAVAAYHVKSCKMKVGNTFCHSRVGTAHTVQYKAVANDGVNNSGGAVVKGEVKGGGAVATHGIDSVKGGCAVRRGVCGAVPHEVVACGYRHGAVGTIENSDVECRDAVAAHGVDGVEMDGVDGCDIGIAVPGVAVAGVGDLGGGRAVAYC